MYKRMGEQHNIYACWFPRLEPSGTLKRWMVSREMENSWDIPSTTCEFRLLPQVENGGIICSRALKRQRSEKKNWRSKLFMGAAKAADCSGSWLKLVSQTFSNLCL